MKIRGYIYYIFPVDYDTKIKEVEMIDCWLNKYFFWLFEFISNFVGIFLELIGEESGGFVISFRGKEKEKVKNLKNK